MIDGRMWPASVEPGSPEAARRLVDSLARVGYDFVKTYQFLPRDVYFAIADQAKRLGIPLTGHVPLGVSAAEASDAGHRSFPRIAPPPADWAPTGLEQVTMKKLLAALAKALERLPPAPEPERLQRQVLNIHERRQTLLARVRVTGRLSFVRLIEDCQTRFEAIITFLAILDLLKTEDLRAEQESSFGEIVLTTKIIDGKFPDYTRVVPTNYQKRFSIKRLDLLQALQRAAILSNEKFRGLRWMLGAGNLRISCTNNEQEEAQEELEIAYNGEALDIGFNITYLLDVLNNVHSETVDCAFGDANSSMLVTVPDNKEFRYVVMPMRI